MYDNSSLLRYGLPYAVYYYYTRQHLRARCMFNMVGFISTVYILNV